MATYIRIRATDFTDGIPSTTIPSGPTTQTVSPAKFVATTEFSRLRFTCIGTTFSAQFARDSTSVINAVYNDCAVYVDGKYAGKITPTLNVVAWYPFTMSTGGGHVVELQCGQGGVNGGSLYMTCGQVLAIAGTGLTVDRSQILVDRRLWIFGDSIVCANAGTDTLGVTDFYSLIRANYPGRVSGDAMGTLAYSPWSNVQWLVERIKRHTTGATKVDLLCQMGVNDYQGSQVQSMAIQCLPMFTAFAAVPSLNKMVVLTPISKLTESANGLGYTLTDVRNQIAAAANAVHSPKITVVDGSTFGIDTTNDLYDGTHPNSKGAAKMFAGVRGALGI